MCDVFPTIELQKKLERDGYVVVDFLSKSEVQSLLDFNKENLPPKSLDNSSDFGISISMAASNALYRQKASKQIRSVFAPKLASILTEYEIVTSTFVYKNSDSHRSKVPLHQDPSLVDETVSKSFAVWCPLVDTNEQNGCLQVVRKSHLLTSKKRPFLIFNGFPYGQEILSLMEKQYLVSLPMKAGQALVYDRRLFHGSLSKLTTGQRVAAACSLIPKNTQIQFTYRESRSSDTIEVFEVDNRFFDHYNLGQKPEGVRSLGVFDYEVEPVTPEILVQKLEDKTELAQVNYQKLDEEGYAVIDFLDEDEVQSLLNLYKEASPPKDLEKSSLAATVSSSDLSYRQLLIPKVREVFHRKTAILFPDYKIILGSFLSKKPDALHSEKSFHQDSSSTDEPCVRSFGVWVPLVDVDKQNGCLQVSPKSHLLNSKLRHSLVFGIFPYSQEILSLMQQHYLINVPMKAGQALIYDKRLFHGSPPNLTSAERLVAISILAPKNSPTYFYYVESKASKEVEIFEIDDTFYDRHISGQRPEGVKSLGTVDYEVEPVTPEILIEKLGAGNSNSQKPTRTGYQINFKPNFLEKFNLSAQKIAVLVSNEFEGFSKNGGIGTYYTTLSQKLAADGWTIILLLCQTEAEFQGNPSFGAVHHVFSTHETVQVLNLQPIHQQILAATQQTDLGKNFDHQSFCCQFFIQAIASTFPDAVVYAEFPEIWGFGYRTIQAKQSGLLGSSTLISVTSHGSFEWLQEVNSRYRTDRPQWLWQSYHYEQFSYENADLTYSPSHFLKSKFSGYGWKTAQAKHLPYFVPSLTLADRPPVPQSETDSNQISIVFFGRLEERKGLCTFVEAIQLLDAAIAPHIHLIFIGKVIHLQSSHLQHLDSQQYLDRELGNAFPYTLLPDLSSQAAIQAIADLPHAIVCLTSLQENFPNTALEMGQLPVSLVISDTGGFRETLDLLHRTEAVHWFQPDNPNALAQALTQAIQVYPENPPILKQTDLEPINRNLLNQRLELMSQAFLEAAPKEPITPSVTIALLYWHSATPLLECLTSLAAQTYEHFDVIVMSPAFADEPMQAAIAQAQSQFPGHKYLTKESHGNLGVAYNDLVDKSTGDYFLPFSPDRIASPDLVEKFVTAACTTDAVVVVCPQQVGTAENPETITLIDGNLLKLLEFNPSHDLTALFSKTLLKQFCYSQERGLLALNWQIFAAAIATDQPIAYYPYPLYTIRPDSPALIPAANLAKERYYLRQSLFQIKPEQWHQRQLNLLLTGFEQLAQVQSQRPPSSPQDQAWMITAQQMHTELTQSQSRLQELESWSRELQTGKDWLESQWQTGMLQTQKAEVEWQRSRSLIQEMQDSKFWKLRQVWLKLKRKLSKISTDPLQPAAHTLTPGVQEFVSRIAGQKVRFFQAAASPTPVVSIISACFSEYAYIEATYRSLINQTLQNFEWIIVDDGSIHPGIKDLLTALPQRTAKIRIVSHAAHRGMAASYNTAIAEANGNYLCFIDLGSILDPTYLEKCALFLETHPQISVVNSYSVMFQSEEHWWQPHLNQPSSLFYQNGMISHPMYRKPDFDSLGGFDESLHGFTEWERCLKSIAHAQIGWTIPEYLDCYRATSENAPAIAQRPDGQQTISAIHSRHQTVPSLPSATVLGPQPLKLETLNSKLNVENPLDRPNPGKRILLFCEALDNSGVAQWNCDLVILLEQRGYDVTIATTSHSDHSCQEFFYRATPDIFHLPNLCDRVHWIACIRHLLNSRQIDSVLVSSSELAYSFLPSLRAEFPRVALMDYLHGGSAIGQISPTHPLSQSLDCRIVASHRQARESASSNSYTKTRVCSTQADVEIALAEAIKARHTVISTETNADSEEALALLLEDLQEPIVAAQPQVIKAEAPAEPSTRQLLKLLLRKLVKG